MGASDSGGRQTAKAEKEFAAGCRSYAYFHDAGLGGTAGPRSPFRNLHSDIAVNLFGNNRRLILSDYGACLLCCGSCSHLVFPIWVALPARFPMTATNA
jgi:hypothetical protein